MEIASRRFGARACAMLFAGALALALVPATQALADGWENNIDLNNESGIVLATVPDGGSAVKWPDGTWVQTADEEAQGIYKWENFIRGDNAHYGYYDVTTTFQVKDGELTAIDLTSNGTSFGGRWGVLTPHSGAVVVGYLPDGVEDDVSVAFDVAQESAASEGEGDDTATSTATVLTHALKNADVYGGYAYNSIVLYAAEADGTKNEVGTLAYSAGGRGKAAGWTATPAGEEHAGFATFENGMLTINDAAANLVYITETIGQYYVFGQYYGLDEAGQAAAEQLTESNQTDFTVEPSGIGQKDRDVYTAAAYNLIVRKQLASFLAYEDGNGELADLDTVSAATKSSQSLIEAIYAGNGIYYPWSNDDAAEASAADWEPLYTSVADDVVVTIDGADLPADATATGEDADGNRTITSALFGDNVAVAGFDLYAIDGDLSNADMWRLSGGAYSAEPLRSYRTGNISATGHGIVGAYGVPTKQGRSSAVEGDEDILDDDAIFYDPETRTLTVKDKSVTKVVFNFAVGKFSDPNGGVCGVAYALPAATADEPADEPAAKPVAQTITAKDVTKTYGAKAFSLGASAKTALSYKSGNTKVATVDAKGKVTIKGAGTAKIIITAAATDAYQKATKTVTVKVNKAKNTMTVKAKSPAVKAAKVKKAKQTIAATKAFTVKKALGKVTYAKASGNKKITVTKAGEITVKKGLKKGTYKVKVKVKAAGNGNYQSLTKTVTVKVKVK